RGAPCLHQLPRRVRQADQRSGRDGLPRGGRVPEVGGGRTAQRRPGCRRAVPEREEPRRSAGPRDPAAIAVPEAGWLAAPPPVRSTALVTPIGGVLSCPPRPGRSGSKRPR